MEWELLLWDLVEYHENDFKGIEAMEIFFKTIKQLFMRGIANISQIKRQLMLKMFLRRLFWDSNHDCMGTMARYLSDENWNNLYGWCFESNEIYE